MDKSLGERLKKARNYLHLSQEFVASQIGIPRTAVTAIELGQRKVTAEELKIFSELYGVTLDELIHGEDIDANLKILARLYSDLSEIDKMEIQNLMEFKRNLKKYNGALR